jgi:hypothetical protein
MDAKMMQCLQRNLLEELLVLLVPKISQIFKDRWQNINLGRGFHLKSQEKGSQE